jgi:hypothetical protein
METPDLCMEEAGDNMSMDEGDNIANEEEALVQDGGAGEGEGSGEPVEVNMDSWREDFTLEVSVLH